MTTIKLEEPGSTSDSFETGSTLGFADELNNNKSRNMDDHKCVVISVAIVAITSIVGLVLAALAISRSGGLPTINVGTNSLQSSASAGSGSQPIVIQTGDRSSSGTDKTYTIAVGHDWGAHNYFDQEGYITGFTKEVIAEVCQAAGIDCRTVWDKWSNCWDSSTGQHSAGGKGLLGRWYDACSGWAVTVNRAQVFNFGASYLTPETDRFFVKRGASFDPKDITNKKIGFLDGFATDEKCIARQTDIRGNIIPVHLIKLYAQVTDAVNALLSGEVDAVAADSQSMSNWMDKIEAKGEFNCVLGGGTIMSRKDSDLVGLWNAGFQKLQSSGRFSEMCKGAQEKHGDKGEIRCV